MGLDEELYFAAQKCDIDRARELLERGADPNARDSVGATPLHYAALNGHVNAVKKLLEHGADVNARDKDGFTPLHVAACKGYVDVLGLILQYGADLNMQSRRGWTPYALIVFYACAFSLWEPGPLLGTPLWLCLYWLGLARFSS
jgi:ankyrin repeat protein